jgi:hypothetical protein
MDVNVYFLFDNKILLIDFLNKKKLQNTEQKKHDSFEKPNFSRVKIKNTKNKHQLNI